MVCHGIGCVCLPQYACRSAALSKSASELVAATPADARDRLHNTVMTCLRCIAFVNYTVCRVQLALSCYRRRSALAVVVHLAVQWLFT